MSRAEPTPNEVARRDALLEDVAEGLQLLDRVDDRRGVARSLALWRIEIAMLDPEGRCLAVGRIVQALPWIVERTTMSANAQDISGATQAHVQVFEGGCVHPACDGKTHREDPGEDQED